MNTVDIHVDLTELLHGKNIRKQLSVPQLVENALHRNEGTLTDTGALRVSTGKYTGRSPQDKYIVEEESTKDKINWGDVNQPISKEIFHKLYSKVLVHLKQQKNVFQFKGYAGADKATRLPIQVINEYAWHNLFAHQLFIRPTEEELETHEAQFSVVYAPTFKANPAVDGTRSETFIMVSFEEKIVLIGGTEYAGESKKGIFSIMNYLLPEQDILSMHCSANVGDKGDVALFFGLSGTGKTTLSADSERKLIGDDEHGWSDNGVFNIEGGCYAKCVGLTREKEPEIYDTIKFGAVLENVGMDQTTRIPDYNDVSLTENTRVAYPIESIQNIAVPSVAGHPNTIIFLTADACGVLPPISKLTKEQAMYHFVSGYTSKLAGTERGITSPQATFSTCFGSPFLPLDSSRYAEMLGEKIDKHNVSVFLVNTGWTGGEYGVGNRMKLAYTRGMIKAALAGELNSVDTFTDAIFGLAIPTKIEGIPADVLIPRNTWSDKDAYDAKATELAHQFKENIKLFPKVSEDIIKKGGPIA